MRSNRSLARYLPWVLLALVSMVAPWRGVASLPTLVVVGDSLSAAYNMELSESWPQLLEDRLARSGVALDVVNASITGETTQGGVTRLPRLLERHSPEWVVIELGGNDGLRGFSLDVTRNNLARMIELSQASGARVVLAGIRLPPNYGPGYIERFEAIYGELAERYGTLLVPFFMEGVALVDGMMQGDGIHPSVEAQPVLLDNLWQVLEPGLKAGASPAPSAAPSAPADGR